MTDSVYAEVKGWSLVLMKDDPWLRATRKGEDLWCVADGDWDGPNEPRPISEWPKVIDEWMVEKQKAEGFPVWTINHDNPKYWSRGDAVFRTGLPKSDPNYYRSGQTTHSVYMRNGPRPESLHSQPRGYVALDTPEVIEAIETARQAHTEAVEAAKRFREAKAAIPTMTEEEWLRLKPKPGGER